MCTESSHVEDGLQRRLCALLSLPWLCENKSSSEYRIASFPSWAPALAQRLTCCYCEYLRYITICMKIQIFFMSHFLCEYSTDIRLCVCCSP